MLYMSKIVAERITYRLSISMLVIILSLLGISIPLIISSYQDYIKTKNALIEIRALNAVADLANKISRERGPANKAMSSNAQQLIENQQALREYRQGVDQQIKITALELKQAGFMTLAYHLNTHVVASLAQGRHDVDAYLNTPIAQRQALQFDRAILMMFNVWDQTHDVLKNVVMRSKNKDSTLMDSYTLILILILILADLRDQAGRVASNVIAHVSFNVPLPNTNIARSLQTQKQVQYLWDLVNTLQPENEKTPEFIHLHQQVKTEFIDQGLPMVLQLIDESTQGKSYNLQGTAVTDRISGYFSTVVDLQKYLLDDCVYRAEQHLHEAQNKLIWTAGIAFISLLAALFTMIYARKRVFVPLIQARKMILNLVQHHGKVSHSNTRVLDEDRYRRSGEFFALFEAIYKLQHMLAQRDAFETQLKNMARTDALTGVSNRTVLDEYVQYLEGEPARFIQLGLIVVDIDNFKTVNDQYGHSIGDGVIVEVAQCLKQNIRHSDLIVRFGGDEFLILIPDVEIKQVTEIAEKIRHDVSNLNIDVPHIKQRFTISVSIGIAGTAENWKDLFHQADQSLFRAKALGKNKVAG